MIRRLSHMFACAAVAALVAGAVSARPHLSEVDEINDGLFVIAVAKEIRDYCPEISARTLKAYDFLWKLRKQAREMGYSDTEIKAYIGDDKEKAKMRVRGEAYLKEHGVTYEDPQTFCALGRVEIEKSSRIGALLRAK
ncbi:DUF5333 domain-containing protein [Shimia sp. CNT1-13L.2]|uniref:DUF5333 domain-containing protein n=1 Tax=Shimia sp. CNT1-13L.2 TaxID=2959663 RepID=UPI0020CBC279|nr:DUF5333 domain-containing protein [Shimia sp. CNT1-13L.2]MCP9481569.1 DUF5333 domain-containing protein [Shimia sp. CNT1-13L.2]